LGSFSVSPSSYATLTLYSFFFSSLLLPRPPPSTLFPYTTLFRSHRSIHGKGQDSQLPPFENRLTGSYPDPLFLKKHQPSCRPHRDRKSTRLNSSHVSISYAVFCLKKKKRNKKSVKI